MINVPVSVGELIDKLSILQVKKRKVSDSEKLIFIEKEFEILYNLCSEYLNDKQIEELYHKLVKTNSQLWDIEDNIRQLEKDKKFGSEFIETSRKVYYTNDERFDLKNQINFITSSEIREIKEYVDYKH